MELDPGEPLPGRHEPQGEDGLRARRLMSTQTWYFAEGGERTGPLSEDEMRAAVSAGRITPETLVWCPEMTEWAPLSTTRLADVAMPPTGAKPAPPAPPMPGAAPVDQVQWAPPAQQATPHVIATWPRFEVGSTILLAIITCGIYGLVMFFQTSRAYERHAGREFSFATFFWLYIIFTYAGAAFGAVISMDDPTSVSPIQGIIGLAGVACGGLALNACMKAREVISQAVQVRTAGLHLGLWIGGSVISNISGFLVESPEQALPFIGLAMVAVIVQAVFYLEDHKAITENGLGNRQHSADAFR